MTPQLHRHKAERIVQSLAKLGDADWEIRIEAAMLAGTHWINFALHQSKVSPDAEDVVHASMCLVCMLRKYKLAEPQMLAWLEEIEELRPLFVRGDVPGGLQASHRALELLRAIEQRALELA